MGNTLICIAKYYAGGFDNLKSHKKTILFMVILLLVFALYGWLSNKQKYYGNDTDDIKNTIMAKTGIESDVSIFDMTDIGHYRLAGFINGDYDSDKMGYVTFKKEYPNNYIFERIYVTNQYGDGVEAYVSSLDDKNFSVIIGNNAKFAQVKRIIADGDTDIVNISHNPSLTLMQEPKFANTSIAFYFYDEYGNELE